MFNNFSKVSWEQVNSKLDKIRHDFKRLLSAMDIISVYRDPDSLAFCAESRLMLLLILFCLVTDFLPRYDLRDLPISLKLLNVIVIKLVYL